MKIEQVGVLITTESHAKTARSGLYQPLAVAEVKLQIIDSGTLLLDEKPFRNEPIFRFGSDMGVIMLPSLFDGG